MSTPPPLAEEREPKRLSMLLKRCRTHIAPDRAALGVFLRMPNRIGKGVTQEEVAEAVGISRKWYAALECDRVARVSARVLSRIADTLMMDPAERGLLFRLALPELRTQPLADTSTAILDAFGSVRRLTRRLWAANSEAEALTIVGECAMTQLTPDVMVTRTRLRNGSWECTAFGDAENRAERVLALLSKRWGPAVLDDIHGYTVMAQPGDVMTRSDLETLFPDLVAKRRASLEEVGWADVSWAMANVRSQRGFIGRILATYHTRHAFSEVEQALLSTIADLTSLAVSD